MASDELKIGFLNHFSQYWLGGITYFRNLFLAMSTTESPKLKPFILPPADKSADCLLPYVSIFPDKEISADPEHLPSAADYHVDVLSHLQELKGRDGIAWIADFQHVHLPEMFSEQEIAYRNQTFRTLTEQNRIVCLSSYDAMEDFRNFAPEAGHKARCLHFVSIPDPAIYQFTPSDESAIRRKLQLPERYFYVPNQFWKHKNHIVVLQAVAHLKKAGCPIHIVFSGNTFDVRFPDYFDELKEFCRKEQIEENVHFLGMIDLKEVYFLMRDCLAIINPSKFEGWSSSVEEAKSIGKTIILSNLNVHYEQAPPHGFYFPCNDPVWLAGLLERAWKEMQPGPDLAMEERARQLLPVRIRQFGKDFQKIVQDALAGESICSTPTQTEPKVTVVTVIFNLLKAGRKEQIIRNLESVAAQKGTAVEHLIVDGCSTDGTGDFLQPYLEKYGCRLISEPDHGIYEAMNHGTIHARGKYVAYLNSDDYYTEPDFLQKSVSALEKGAFDFSYAPVQMRNPDGTPFDHIHTHPDETICFVEMPFCHQSMLFLRKALYSVAVYNDTFRSSGDYDLILRLILSGKRGVRIDCAGACFTVSGFSQSNMELAQRECGLIYSRLYSGLGFAMTPEEGHQLYLKKVLPESLRKILYPYCARAFAASRPDLRPQPVAETPSEPQQAPQVSVILPLSGDTRFPEELIESIRRQCFDDYEVLIPDSGLPEKLKETVDAWVREDKRVRFYRASVNPWNAGISAARGKYLYFAVGGQTMAPECLAHMTAALNERHECSVCDSRIQLTGSQGHAVADSGVMNRYFGHFSYPAEVKHVRLAPYDFFQNICGKAVCHSPGQIMVRRDLFDLTGDFPENTGKNAVYLWNLYASYHANVVYLPEYLVSCRIDPGTGILPEGNSDCASMYGSVQYFLSAMPEGACKKIAAELSELLHFKEMLLPLKTENSRRNRMFLFCSALKHFPGKCLQLAFLKIKFRLSGMNVQNIPTQIFNTMIILRMKKYHWMILDGNMVPHLSRSAKLKCCIRVLKKSPKKGLKLVWNMMKILFSGGGRNVCVQTCNTAIFDLMKMHRDAISGGKIAPYSLQRSRTGEQP